MTEHQKAAVEVALREWDAAFGELGTSAVPHGQDDLHRISVTYATLAAEIYREWE